MSVSGIDRSGSGGDPAGSTNELDPTARKGVVRGEPSASDGGESSPSIGGLSGITPEEWQKYLLLMAQQMCTDCQDQNQKSIDRQRQQRKEEESRSQS